MKPLRIFVALILSAGASLTARAMYLHAKADLASVLIHRAWNKTVVDGQPHPPWRARPRARWLSGPRGYLAERAWANRATWNSPGTAQAGFSRSNSWKPVIKFKSNGSTLASANFASELTTWTRSALWRLKTCLC